MKKYTKKTLTKKEQIESLIQEYDLVVDNVHLKRITKEKAYYVLVEILFEFRELHRIE